MKSPAEYIAAVEPGKQPSLKKLHQLIRRTLPELETCMVHGMIGYGPYHYRYDSGREGDTARVALAANKTGYSVYIMAVDATGKYIAESAKATLGKATVGKSCIRFKRLEDIAVDGLTRALLQVRTAIALGERRAEGRLQPGASAKRRAAPKKRAPAKKSAAPKKRAPAKKSA